MASPPDQEREDAAAAPSGRKEEEQEEQEDQDDEEGVEETKSEADESEEEDDQDQDQEEKDEPPMGLEEGRQRLQNLRTLHGANLNDIISALSALGLNEERTKDTLHGTFGKMPSKRRVLQIEEVSVMKQEVAEAQTRYSKVKDFRMFVAAFARLSHIPATLHEEELRFDLDRNVILIGRNGVGKSSLLTAAANARPAYAPPTFHVPAQLDVNITTAAPAAPPSSNDAPTSRLCELIGWACESEETVDIVQPVLDSVWGELDTGKALRVDPPGPDHNGRFIVSLHSGPERVFKWTGTCLVDEQSGRERRSALSDGELRALYYILVALKCSRESPECIIVLDEPETNMNAALSAPLLKQLVINSTFAKVNWTLITHDFYLVRCLQEDIAQDNPKAFRVLLLSAPAETQPDDQHNMYAGTYRIAPVPLNSAGMADQTLRLLFGRSPVVLCEGTLASDMTVYSALFPWLEFRAYGGCENVISALNAEHDTTYGSRSFSVAGKLSSRRLMGLIDRDNRDAQDVNARCNRRVMVLDAWGIEGLLLSPACIEGLTDEPITDDLVQFYRDLITAIQGMPDAVVKFMAMRRHMWNASTKLRHVVERSLTQDPTAPGSHPKFPKMHTNVNDVKLQKKFTDARLEELGHFRANRNDVIWPVLEDPEVRALAEEEHFRLEPPDGYDDQSLNDVRSFYCDLLRHLRGHTIIEMLPHHLIAAILRKPRGSKLSGGKPREQALMRMVVDRIKSDGAYAEGVRNAVLGSAGSDDPPSVELLMSHDVKDSHFKHAYDADPVTHQRKSLQTELRNESYGLHFKRSRVAYDVHDGDGGAGALFLFGVPGDVSTENYLVWDMRREDVSELTNSNKLTLFSSIVNNSTTKGNAQVPPGFAHTVTMLVASVFNSAASSCNIQHLEFACLVLRKLLDADSRDSDRFADVAIAVVNLATDVGFERDEVRDSVSKVILDVVKLLKEYPRGRYMEPTPARRRCAAARVVTELLRKLHEDEVAEETRRKWGARRMFAALSKLDSPPPEFVLICSPVNVDFPITFIEAFNAVDVHTLASHVKHLTRDVLLGTIPDSKPEQSFMAYVFQRAQDGNMDFVRTVVPATMQAVASLECDKHGDRNDIQHTVGIMGDMLDAPDFKVAHHHIVNGLYAMRGVSSSIDFTIVTHLAHVLATDSTPVAARRSMFSIIKLVNRKSARRWVVFKQEDREIFELRQTENGPPLEVRLPSALSATKVAEALRNALQARHEARVAAEAAAAEAAAAVAAATEPPLPASLGPASDGELESKSEDDGQEHEFCHLRSDLETTGQPRDCDDLHWDSVTFGAPDRSPDVYGVWLVSSDDGSQWTGHFYFDLMVCPAGLEDIAVTFRPPRPALNYQCTWEPTDPLRVLITAQTGDLREARALGVPGAVNVEIANARSGEDIRHTLLADSMDDNCAAMLLLHCVARGHRRAWEAHAPSASLLYETAAGTFSMYELPLSSGTRLNVLVRDNSGRLNAFVVATTAVKRDVVAARCGRSTAINGQRPSTNVSFTLSVDTSGNSIYKYGMDGDVALLWLAAKTIVWCVAGADRGVPCDRRRDDMAVPLTPQSTNKRPGCASYVLFTNDNGMVCICNVLSSKQFPLANMHAKRHWLQV